MRRIVIARGRGEEDEADRIMKTPKEKDLTRLQELTNALTEVRLNDCPYMDRPQINAVRDALLKAIEKEVSEQCE